jgi:hypothetical protein
VSCETLRPAERLPLGRHLSARPRPFEWLLRAGGCASAGPWPVASPTASARSISIAPHARARPLVFIASSASGSSIRSERYWLAVTNVTEPDFREVNVVSHEARVGARRRRRYGPARAAHACSHADAAKIAAGDSRSARGSIPSPWLPASRRNRRGSMRSPHHEAPGSVVQVGARTQPQRPRLPPRPSKRR